MASRIDSNPEHLLKALVHNARLHGAVEPGTPPWALAWLLEELGRLRAVELAHDGCTGCGHDAELARLHEVLESRTPTREQWEHAAQLIFRWMAREHWYQASDDVQQCYRTRAAQVGVELGLIDG